MEQKADEVLKEMLGGEGEPAKAGWHIGKALKEHMEAAMEAQDCSPISLRHLTRCTGPERNDLVFHDVYATSPDQMVWPENPNVQSSVYWEEWAKWTIEFSCRSKPNAISSLQRWRGGALRDSSIPEWAAQKVLDALSDARSRGEGCTGLSSIPNDVFLTGQGKAANGSASVEMVNEPR